MSAFKVKITGFDQIEDHIEYSIVVSNVLTETNHNFSHRYSILRQIYYSLKPLNPHLTFPKKKIFAIRSSKFLAKRKTELENFLNSAFADSEMRKSILATEYFKVKNEEIKSQMTGKHQVDKICMACGESLCWQIVNRVGERMLDFSCHPGSMNDSEIWQVKEGIYEKCKDLKVLIRDGIDINLDGNEVEEKEQRVKENTAWALKAFDSCLEVIGFKLLI